MHDSMREHLGLLPKPVPRIAVLPCHPGDAGRLLAFVGRVAGCVNDIGGFVIRCTLLTLQMQSVFDCFVCAVADISSTTEIAYRWPTA